MTLKIERISSKRRTRIRLSGAFRSEHRDQVKAEIERGGPRIALDLEEVDLVDVEGVRFLNACRGRGDLSAALPALYQGMDAPGTRVGQKHPISVQGKSWLEEEDAKQEWRRSVGKAAVVSAADANSLTGADDGTIQHVSREREGRKSHDGRGDIEYPHGHFQSRTEGAGLRCS